MTEPHVLCRRCGGLYDKKLHPHHTDVCTGSVPKLRAIPKPSEVQQELDRVLSEIARARVILITSPHEPEKADAILANLVGDRKVRVGKRKLKRR